MKFLFAKAEEYAIETSVGMWNKSSFYGCFRTTIDKYEEVVKIESLCGNISLSGWKLKDESRKIYKFPQITIGIITLNSKNGTDNETDIFWNIKTSVWNNDRDTLYIFDNNNNLAHRNCYGY